MKRRLVCIVIPIHSTNPTALELISFQQCFRILSNHPIYTLAPEGLNLTRYKEVVSSFETIFIPARWQSSLQAYNKLKVSRFFYKLFSGFEYLLTYELDAFVFRDELLYWCNKGYDYIGAPWFEGLDKANEDSKLIGVGNSGFSLRKVTEVRKVLRSYFYKHPREYNTGKKNLIKAYLKYPFRWTMNQLGENYTVQKYYRLFEDHFFCRVIPETYKGFQIAPVEDAWRFSFEVNPRHLYKLNQRQLPFGCHAWWRYDFDFWKPFIEQFEYKLDENPNN